MRTRQKVPERLTLVDTRSTWPTQTLMVEEGEDRHLIVATTTSGSGRTEIYLTEVQAKRVVARINKYCRDIR